MKLRLLLITLFAAITLSPVPLQVWALQDGSFVAGPNGNGQRHLLPANSLSGFDFGSTQDCFLQAGPSIKIVDCQNQALIKWQSAESWRVSEAISADLNRDGKNELVMVVWRPHKTWPIDSFLPSGGRIAGFHDSSGSSCHLILVGWDGKKYRELWAGSSLIDPIFDIRAADIDRDGNQELVTLEGKYDNKSGTGSLTVWDWSGFGFRLRARKPGSFSEFGIVSTDKGVLIVSD